MSLELIDHKAINHQGSHLQLPGEKVKQSRKPLTLTSMSEVKNNGAGRKAEVGDVGTYLYPLEGKETKPDLEQPCQHKLLFKTPVPFEPV